MDEFIVSTTIFFFVYYNTVKVIHEKTGILPYITLLETRKAQTLN